MVVSLLSNLPAVGRLVEDRTGLTGSFDLELSWSPDAAPAPQTPGPDAVNPTPTGYPSLFTAVREQIGLELSPARSAVDVVVIDRAKPPTAN